MADDKLQQAIKHLSIADVYLVASEARHGEGFNPKVAHALEGLKVQTMHVARRSEILETEKADQFLLRIVLGFGVRWISESESELDQSAIRALVEADYVAEYLMDERLDQEAIDAFALQNASYHVWPYWREYLMSQCERLRMPRLILPTRQFPDNQKQ
ncbi:MAG: preprotein translocase subunit SecB [Pseudomonadota bacterium]|nr:preprotein translocase subunit SecB [Pseudomonadota bacterium]